MQVKRFYSSSVEDAMRAAREQMGRDAVMLSTDLVPSPGWRGWMGERLVAVTAAITRPIAAVTARVRSADRPSASPRRQSPDVPARAGVVARLTATGVDLALAERVVNRMTLAEYRSGTEAAVRRELAYDFRPLIAADEGLAPIEVFVGPPGVGKTTTIAKIAAGRRVAGHRPPALVAADGFRAGAVEHLRAYATIIGAPFRPARSGTELDRALTSVRHGVLVDTAGRSPSDPAFLETWAIIASRPRVRTHLVLAASTSPALVRRTLEKYAPTRPSRVIITKIDEADSVAPVLAELRHHRLPVSYLTSGQRVPEDLATATADGLAQVVLGAAEEGACH